MTEGGYSTHSRILDDRTVRFVVTDSEGALSWRAVLAGWRGDSRLADALGRALAELPFAAFRWETPAMTADRLETAFECVAVDDPYLDVRPDPAPFAEYLSDNQSVVSFPNLGGDALMIVPCRRAREHAYGHRFPAPRTARTAAYPLEGSFNGVSGWAIARSGSARPAAAWPGCTSGSTTGPSTMPTRPIANPLPDRGALPAMRECRRIRDACPACVVLISPASRLPCTRE